MAARDAALDAGFSTLRFNFRGTGWSEGIHDDGRGEVDDLDVALGEAGAEPIIIGYSFGAWVAANLLVRKTYPSVLIAPPTGMLSFPSLKGSDIRVVVGGRDQFCRHGALGEIVDPDRITVVDGIDHFWFGYEGELRSYLDPVLKALSANSPT
jgi:alpha/beta superfamily hydrolase